MKNISNRMNKVYSHKEVEEKIYKFWEEKGYFKPETNPKRKPYCIILPPPNANGALHFGHAMFTVEDILIRFKRMQGFSTLWLPGTDHAGIETQFVFEKKLKAEGKSRLDFDQETLYKMIFEYVEKNRGGIEKQLRRLGFSLDWSREKYTLDKGIVKLVYKTFKWMYDDGLVYRDYRLVNYCTFDGTSFSDLEVINEESEGSLYEIKYELKGTRDFISVATTRPETMFGDEAIMVNPEDKRYKDKLGMTAIIPLINKEIPIIADESVDMEFGTGAVKVTPLHDFNDYEVAKRHNLPMKTIVIGFDGKMKNTGIVDGLFAKKAREEIINKLKEENKLGETKNHKLVLRKCYKCKNILEPLPLDQWFVKVKPLAKKAIEVVKDGKIKIYPKNFEKIYVDWLENLRDWNISRQIVWGIRIPAFRNTKTGEWKVTEGEIPQGDYEQDKDTFDTWFSSGQWPYLTLKTSNSGDFEKFYPTDVMETAYDILKVWVSRMVMLGIYIQEKQGARDEEKQIPFKNILFHGIVNDPYGKKMSKSKGNVVDPLEIVDQYGADSVRFALIYGNATGNDQMLSYPKLDAARKFSNKLWNLARFIEFSRKTVKTGEKATITNKVEEWNDLWKNKVQKLAKEITQDINKYNFNFAAEKLYEFTWHEFADKYIEDSKMRMSKEVLNILEENFTVVLKLLHPFMPFITEEIYQKLNPGESIMISEWPK